MYRCDLRGVSNASILQGSIDSASLGEPLGIAPDYALLCNVDRYDEKGNIVVNHSQILKITMMLFDLKEKKIVWTTSTTGMATTSLLRGFLILGLTGVMLEAGNEPDDLRTVREAIMNAMDTVPIVNGFQGGTISPIDRK